MYVKCTKTIDSCQWKIWGNQNPFYNFKTNWNCEISMSAKSKTLLCVLTLYHYCTNKTIKPVFPRSNLSHWFWKGTSLSNCYYHVPFAFPSSQFQRRNKLVLDVLRVAEELLFEYRSYWDWTHTKDYLHSFSLICQFRSSSSSYTSCRRANEKSTALSARAETISPNWFLSFLFHLPIFFLSTWSLKKTCQEQSPLYRIHSKKYKKKFPFSKWFIFHFFLFCYHMIF